MELSIQLSRIFLDNPVGVYSIHQISKKLEIPYGTAYNRIHILGKIGIVNIIPQGKAKLCALNPASPMTASILGLGASQIASTFLKTSTPVANLIGKVRDFLDTNFRDLLHSAILLNAEALAALPGGELPHVDKIASGSAEKTGVSEEDFSSGVSLDLFLVMAEEGFDIQDLETSLLSVVPHQYHIRFTRMIVTPSTLIGMLQEKENEAGISAFHMLRKGMILTGFEKFFGLIMRALGTGGIRI